MGCIPYHSAWPLLTSLWLLYWRGLERNGIWFLSRMFRNSIILYTACLIHYIWIEIYNYLKIASGHRKWITANPWKMCAILVWIVTWVQVIRHCATSAYTADPRGWRGGGCNRNTQLMITSPSHSLCKKTETYKHYNASEPSLINKYGPITSVPALYLITAGAIISSCPFNLPLR